MGYSLGGFVALRMAIQHPQLVRRLVLVSVAFRRDGSHPEVVAAMDQMSPEIAEMLKQSPLYELYSRSPRGSEDWPVLIAKTSEMLKYDYDWTSETRRPRGPPCSSTPTPIRCAPRTSSSSTGSSAAACATPAGTARHGPPRAWRSCPGTTHYDIYDAAGLAPAVVAFLDAPRRDPRRQPSVSGSTADDDRPAARAG